MSSLSLNIYVTGEVSFDFSGHKKLFFKINKAAHTILTFYIVHCVGVAHPTDMGKQLFCSKNPTK